MLKIKLKPQIHPEPRPPLEVSNIQVQVSPVEQKVLDFDIECRPLAWLGGDFVTKEITAIAAKFLDEDPIYCWLLGVDEPERMLVEFVELYDRADVVTGHYIRGYDLPTINGALHEYGQPPLDTKLTHDTKLDLIKQQGISGSQENLAAMLGITAPKIQMNNVKWREANRLTEDGLRLTRERAVGDILQHIELRQALMDQGWIGLPKIWHSLPATSSKYRA